MDDDQRPWWTRPPEPSGGTRPEPADTSGQASEQEESPRLNGSHVAAPTQAFSPEAAEQAPAEQTPAPPALPPELPFGAARPQRGVRRTVPPSQQLVGEEPAHRPAPSAALTEQLPPIRDDAGDRDDALGVYGAPTGVAPGIPGISDGDDPLGHLREEGPRRPALGSLPGQLSGQLSTVAPKLADRRVLGTVGAVVAVLVVVLAVRGLFGGPDDDENTAADQAAATSTSAQEESAGTFGGVKRLDGDAAIKDLERVKDAGSGEVAGAWEWTDENGRNLFVTMRTPKGENADLRVVHAAALQTNSPQTLRVMNDPGLPNCSGEGAAGFTKNSVKVTDLDKNGIAEVTVGWTSRCGGKGEPSTAKLALLTDGDKYILRGEGVVGKTGQRASEPKRAGWPKAYFTPVTQQFDELYFTAK